MEKDKRVLSHRFIIAVLLANASFLLTAPLYAGGSLGFDEIRPMLERNKLGQWLLNNLDFEDGAGGTRLGHHWKHLGGARQGPYNVTATLKGSGTTVTVQIATDITYYAGKEKLWSGASTYGRIPDQLEGRIIDEADRFTETLRCVQIIPPGTDWGEYVPFVRADSPVQTPTSKKRK